MSSPRSSTSPALSHSVTRPASLDAVLEFAWGAGQVTAADVMQATELTRATAIEALSTLVGLGLLRELPNAREAGEYRKGRPARRFEFRADAAVVVGVDAGFTHLIARASDLRGRTLSSATAFDNVEDTEHDPRSVALQGGDRRRRAVDSVVTKALSDLKPGLPVVAICVGIPAPVDAHGTSPQHSVGFWQRINPDLTKSLRHLAAIVRVENDASLSAVAEGALGAAQGSKNYVSLLAGSRMGAGIVIDGHLLRGARGGVGEMGAFNHVEGVGDSRGLGSYVTLLARKWSAEGLLAKGGKLQQIPAENLDGKTILELAAQGDPDAQRIAGKAGARLARIVSVLGSTYDPELVVVGGSVSRTIDPVIAAARSHLPDALDSPPPTIIASELAGDAVVEGAVVAAVESAQANLLDLVLTGKGWAGLPKT